MTKAGNFLVRVRAQVMTRDDSSDGWVTLNGGGLANVSVRRRLCRRTNHDNDDQSDISDGDDYEGDGDDHKNPTNDVANAASSSNGIAVGVHGNPTLPEGTTSTDATPAAPDEPKYEYLIYGKRITDQTVVLSCTIKEDFEYYKVMPTFHHWRTGHERFGLTFQTAADARAFDKGVRAAVEELLEGIIELSMNRPAHGRLSTEDGGDEPIFEIVNLPALPTEPRAQQYVRQVMDYDSAVQLLVKPQLKLMPKSDEGLPHEPAVNIASDNNAYVQLPSLQQEYRIQHVINEQPRRDPNQKFIEEIEKFHSTDSLKKQPDLLDYEKPINPPVEASDTSTMKIWQLVSPDDNREKSRNPIMCCIECISFVPCARSMVARRRDLPHRATFKREAYSCASEDKSVDNNVRSDEHIRSIVRSVMSWIPCLHCYRPLASTHDLCARLFCCKATDV